MFVCIYECFIIKAKKFSGYFSGVFFLLEFFMQHMVLLITLSKTFEFFFFLARISCFFLLFLHPFLFSRLGFTFSAGGKKGLFLDAPHLSP